MLQIATRLRVDDDNLSICLILSIKLSLGIAFELRQLTVKIPLAFIFRTFADLVPSDSPHLAFATELSALLSSPTTSGRAEALQSLWRLPHSIETPRSLSASPSTST